MLASAGCSHVLVGHSERRQYFGETDATVAKRMRAALDAGLVPIVCVGETLAEREAGRTEEVVLRQFDDGPGTVTGPDARRVVLAYEPVWAIGTGRNATPAQAAEVHALLRARARERWGDAADRLGSSTAGRSRRTTRRRCSPSPADGALVGGASLTAASFPRDQRGRRAQPAPQIPLGARVDWGTPAPVWFPGTGLPSGPLCLARFSGTWGAHVRNPAVGSHPGLFLHDSRRAAAVRQGRGTRGRVRRRGFDVLRRTRRRHDPDPGHDVARGAVLRHVAHARAAVESAHVGRRQEPSPGRSEALGRSPAHAGSAAARAGTDRTAPDHAGTDGTRDAARGRADSAARRRYDSGEGAGDEPARSAGGHASEISGRSGSGRPRNRAELGRVPGWWNW